MDKKELLKNAVAAYTHANNLPLDISKKSWGDYINGRTEDEKVRNYLMVQMGLIKRIIDTVIGADCKLSERPSNFLVDMDEVIKKLEKSVN